MHASMYPSIHLPSTRRQTQTQSHLSPEAALAPPVARRGARLLQDRPPQPGAHPSLNHCFRQ